MKNFRWVGFVCFVLLIFLIFFNKTVVAFRIFQYPESSNLDRGDWEYIGELDFWSDLKTRSFFSSKINMMFLIQDKKKNIYFKHKYLVDYKFRNSDLNVNWDNFKNLEFCLEVKNEKQCFQYYFDYEKNIFREMNNL